MKSLFEKERAKERDWFKYGGFTELRPESYVTTSSHSSSLDDENKNNRRAHVDATLIYWLRKGISYWP